MSIQDEIYYTLQEIKGLLEDLIAMIEVKKEKEASEPASCPTDASTQAR
jgi:hypothetical protein